VRYVALLTLVLFLGAVAAACALWAGVAQGGAIAVVLGGAALTVALPVVTGQLGRWGVPGDEPPLSSRRPGRG
jgi:hypothetical protein